MIFGTGVQVLHDDLVSMAGIMRGVAILINTWPARVDHNTTFPLKGKTSDGHATDTSLSV